MLSNSEEERQSTTNLAAAAAYYNEFLLREPQKESDYSTLQTVYFINYKDELYRLIRIDRRTFKALLARLISYSLESERILTAAERLIHFLYIVGQGSRFRAVKSQFRRPLGTISDSFYYTIAVLLSLYKEVVQEPDYKAVPVRIASNSKFFLYFQDCVGILDSSYIKAYITGESKLFRNRKGDLSQNVLAVVDFNILFTYILARQEGSVADVTILGYTRDIDSFRANLPIGKYYLADASYVSSDITLILYSSRVRYYLKEWLQLLAAVQRSSKQQADLRPVDTKELFNLRYSLLRNVVERVFSVLKNRFYILEKRPRYNKETQVRLVYALVALYNFIRRTNIEDTLFKDEIVRIERDVLLLQRADMFNQNTGRLSRSVDIQEKEIDRFQDIVATDIQEDYKHTLATSSRAIRVEDKIP